MNAVNVILLSCALQDVEFNHLCEEAGLAVLKCNHLYHHKVDLQPRGASRQPLVPSVPEQIKVPCRDALSGAVYEDLVGYPADSMLEVTRKAFTPQELQRITSQVSGGEPCEISEDARMEKFQTGTTILIEFAKYKLQVCDLETGELAGEVQIDVKDGLCELSSIFRACEQELEWPHHHLNGLCADDGSFLQTAKLEFKQLWKLEKGQFTVARFTLHVCSSQTALVQNQSAELHSDTEKLIGLFEQRFGTECFRYIESDLNKLDSGCQWKDCYESTALGNQLRGLRMMMSLRSQTHLLFFKSACTQERLPDAVGKSCKGHWLT